ncbi:hypothetical protein ALC60_05448, partial [Trachymyrmex zeteki]
LDFFSDNLGDFSNEHGERLHQNIVIIEQRLKAVPLGRSLYITLGGGKKCWHSKSGSGHGENPRNARLSYRKHPWKPQEYYLS